MSYGPFVTGISVWYGTSQFSVTRYENLYLSGAKARITSMLNQWSREGYQWKETKRTDVEITYLVEKFAMKEGEITLVAAATIKVRIYRVEDGLLGYKTGEYKYTGRRS